MKTINISSINFSYKRNKDIFRDFSLQLEQPDENGKVTVIMGSSGSGKSTLMKLLLKIEEPVAGRIEMHPYNPVISYVPQEPVLFEHLSIKDNARYFKFAGVFKNRFNEALYDELVSSLGLEEVVNASRSVVELSGGQRQRLSLLRALSIQPDFLLLDEPCTGLDAEVKRSFLNKLREITQRYGLFVLYITHHKLEAQLIADEVVYLMMDKQSLVRQAAKGTILEFMEAPPVLEAAYIFRSTEVMILPIKRDASGNVLIAQNDKEVSEFWLVNEDNIQLSNSGGFLFKVISQSSVYTVIRNDEAGIVWVLPRRILSNAPLGESIRLTVTEPKSKYYQTNNEIKNY